MKAVLAAWVLGSSPRTTEGCGNDSQEASGRAQIYQKCAAVFIGSGVLYLLLTHNRLRILLEFRDVPPLAARFSPPSVVLGLDPRTHAASTARRCGRMQPSSQYQHGRRTRGRGSSGLPSHQSTKGRKDPRPGCLALLRTDLLIEAVPAVLRPQRLPPSGR